MTSVTISSKYQIVIPKEVREDLNLKPGQKLVVIEKWNSVELVKIGNIKDARGFLKRISQKGLRDHSERFD